MLFASVLQSHEQLGFCRTGIRSSAVRGLPTAAYGSWQQFCSLLMQSVIEKVIFIVIFCFTCEAFQTQGVSWLESRELVFGFSFIIFYFIKHSAGIQNLRDKRELLSLQILAASRSSSLFPWKEGMNYTEIKQKQYFKTFQTSTFT